MLKVDSCRLEFVCILKSERLKGHYPKCIRGRSLAQPHIVSRVHTVSSSIKQNHLGNEG